MQRIVVLFTTALLAGLGCAQEASAPAVSAAPSAAVGSKEWFDAQITKIDVDAKVRDDASAALAKKPNARIGMTAKQVRDTTNWGEPVKVNRTVTAGHVHEQWVYGGSQYLYFDDGRLTAMQN